MYRVFYHHSTLLFTFYHIVYHNYQVYTRQ